MLFGHQNDDTNQSAGPTPVVGGTDGPQAAGLNPLAVDPAIGASLPVAPAQDSPAEELATSVLDQPGQESAPETTAATDLPAETSPLDVPPTGDTSTAPITTSTDPRTEAGADDLLALKQQALTQLSPLVSQLDQTPEEKFRTTMMMIQSTDNQALIKEAYDAAQQIPDEKARAQALLDVVNEINYFTQQQKSTS